MELVGLKIKKMNRNYNEYIRCIHTRTLSAKGYKFLSRCVDIACKNKGYTRYHKEMKPLREKLTEIIKHLFIDRGMSHTEIADLIKSRKYLK